MSALVVNADARNLSFLADGSVDLVVTSPPYNVGMNYDGLSDSLTSEDYGALARAATHEMWRVLVPGGRAWVNVPAAIPPNPKTEKDEARVSPAAVWHSALMESGLSFRDWIVWDQVGADRATAWGSLWSPNNPNLRGRTELILLFFKDHWNRGRVERNDIARVDWPLWTKNIWQMPCVPRNGHPAPFGEELPKRCILLSTWPGDVVLDPFCGGGTTVAVAHKLRRVGIGVDLSERYCRMAEARVAQGVLL